MQYINDNILIPKGQFYERTHPRVAQGSHVQICKITFWVEAMFSLKIDCRLSGLLLAGSQLVRLM